MKQRNQLKPLKELNLMDRFLFAEAADHTEFMELLLSIIFGEEIALRHPPQTEKEARSRSSQKQIRMDVWAMEEDGTIYNTEPQQRNPYNLPKRSRYYQGLLDSNLLEPGEIDYSRLNDVYIIVIMSFDLFRRGLYRYTFRMSCEEIPELRLEDGAVRMFLSTRGTKADGVSPELMALLRYFEETTDAVAEQLGSPRLLRMQEIVNSIKADEEVGVKYMQAWEEKKLEQMEAFEEGQFELLGDLVRDGTLSLEAAANRLNGKREEFLNWYQKQRN